MTADSVKFHNRCEISRCQPGDVSGSGTGSFSVGSGCFTLSAGGFQGSLQHELIEHFGWCQKAVAFAWAGVEFAGDLVEVGLAVP